jgi:hypothetical protein
MRNRWIWFASVTSVCCAVILGVGIPSTPAAPKTSKGDKSVPPGQPFQALQREIDALQGEVDALNDRVEALEGAAPPFLAGSSGGALSTGNNGPGCGAFIGVGVCAPTREIAAQVVPVSGNLSNLHVRLSAAPGPGIHIRWAIIVNNAGTGLGCDTDDAATSCSNTTVSFPINAGDVVTLEATETTLGGAALAAVSWAVQVQ